MILSCITTVSKRTVLINGIPFKAVQIKGFVVNTGQIHYICINQLYDYLMLYCLYEQILIKN